MAGARIEYTLDDKEIMAALGRLGRVRETIGPAIGYALVKVIEERFRDARDPFGQPWAGLNPAYAEIKRGPGILRESGALMRSITFEADPGEIRVGSNRVYAAVHQFGATITPKAAKALVFRIGGALVHARSVTIPARPYLGFGPADRAAVLEVVEDAVQVALRG